MPRKKKVPLYGGPAPISEVEPEEMEGQPETNAEPEKEPEPVAEPPPKPKVPKPQRAGVTLEVFLRISGKRLHQMAGFRRWAINNGLKRLEVKDWRAEHERFLRLPV